MTLVLSLLATSVGRPALLGEWQGEPVISGIRKAPLAGGLVNVGQTNIEGDAQGDLTVHGGIDRAIYAYSANNWPWWKDEADFIAAPASFGENLTVSGADEERVRIGDRFLWGAALLEVSVPRSPCFKFAMLTGRQDMGPRMIASARSGWYFRVLQTGVAPTAGALVRMVTDEAMPSVREAFAALHHPRIPIETLERCERAPALNKQWRMLIAEKRKRLRENGSA